MFLPESLEKIPKVVAIPLELETSVYDLLEFQLECYTLLEKENARDTHKDQRRFLEHLEKKVAPENYTSRTHTSKLSGENYMAYAQSKTGPLGVDIESRKRNCARACQRVCRQEELSSAPSFQILWTAKEASFKSLENQNKNPQTISQIVTSHWQKRSSNTFLFQATDVKNPKVFIQGVSALNHSFVLSVARLKKNKNYLNLELN